MRYTTEQKLARYRARGQDDNLRPNQQLYADGFVFSCESTREETKTMTKREIWNEREKWLKDKDAGTPLLSGMAHGRIEALNEALYGAKRNNTSEAPCYSDKR